MEGDQTSEYLSILDVQKYGISQGAPRVAERAATCHHDIILGYLCKVMAIKEVS